MYRKSSMRMIAIRVAAVLSILALAPFSVGTAVADFYTPFNIQAGPAHGACMGVTWQAEPTGVTSFSVERTEPYKRWEVPAGQHEIWACEMEPNGWYDFEVCTWYGTDDGDTACATARLQLRETGTMEPDTPTAPRIVSHNVGVDFVGIRWEGSYDYDSWFIEYTLKALPHEGYQEPQTIPYDDDGTWGYYHIGDLLPGRTYIFKVQGCTERIFGIADDHCHDWSVPYPVTVQSLPFPGWQQLDANSATSRLVADDNALYQLHYNGAIFKYTGTPMTGWQQLDGNPATTQIAASGGNLYQRHNNGAIFKYTGAPGAPWQMLDGNPATQTIVADGNDIYQKHRDGPIFKYTGAPGAPWQLLDGNPATAQIAAGGGMVFQSHADGSIWKYTGQGRIPWEQIDSNEDKVNIVADGTKLYKLLRNGSIYTYINLMFMHPWLPLDTNSRTVEIAAAGGNLYQRHIDGALWKYTGLKSQPWQQLDGNGRTDQIAAGGGDLYQRHNNGAIFLFAPR